MVNYMSKNQRYYILIAGIIIYTFMMALLKETTISTWVVILITIPFFVFVMVMSGNVILAFGEKYVIQGEKHGEELINMITGVLPVVVPVVMLYTIDLLNGWYLYLIYAVLGIMFIYFVPSFIISYVKILPDGLEGRYITQLKPVQIKYKDIKEVKLNPMTNTIVVRSNDKKIYIDLTYMDVKQVLLTLQSNVNRSLTSKAYKELNDLYRQFFVKTNNEQLQSK